MKKRLLVLLLVVALAVTVSMFTATAENEIDYATAFENFDPSSTSCPICGEGVTWEVMGTGAPAAGKHYYLDTDVVLSNQWVASTGTVCVHLNGHKLSRTYSVANVSGATVNIMDGKDQKGEFGGGTTGTNPTVQVSGGTLNLYNVDVKSFSGTQNTKTNTTNGRPGGVIGMTSGNVNLYGNTTVSGGKAYQGGNVWVGGGEFTMNAGTSITGGQAIHAAGGSTSGGNVYVKNGATFTMNGGTISGGTAGNTNNSTASGWPTGGNVYVYGTFNMIDGTISGGTALHYGANVHVYGYSATLYGNFTMTGGNIQGGTANYGGGVGIGNYAVAHLEGGTISGGYTEQMGGNVGCAAGGTVYVTGTASITEGDCHYGPGGLGIQGTAHISGGSITGNTTQTGTESKAGGADVCVLGAAAEVNVSGGHIGNFDLGPASKSDTTFGQNDSINLSGTAKIDRLAIGDDERINLGEFATGALVKVIFVKNSTGAASNSGTIANIGDKLIRDFIPYIKCAAASTTWGIGLGKNADNELTMGVTDAQINPRNKTLGEATMMNYMDIRQALAEVNPETEMIYLKNVDAGSNIDDARPYTDGQLSANYTDPIVIDKDVAIDLNGVAIDGTFAVADGKTLTLVDVTADDDLVNGPTSSVKVTGNLAKSTKHPYWGANYIVLQDAETGVAVPHYFSAKVDKAFVKTDEAAVYFGVTFKCDPILAAAVEDFGMVTWLESKSDYKFYTKETEMVVTDGVNQTTGVEIYDIVKTDATDPSNADRAAEKMVVTAYASFNNGTELNSAELSYSLTEIMGLMDEKWEDVSDQEAIYNFYNTWKTEAGWDFANIVAPGAAE